MTMSCNRLKRLFNVMEEIAPTRLAESWDNVGLLLESITPSNASKCTVMLTIDLTEAVFEEAMERNVNAIITYHPTWFSNAKRLTMDVDTCAMRTVALCAANQISIYSPHTCLDTIDFGMNDLVAQVLAGGDDCIASKRPLKPLNAVIRDQFPSSFGLGRIIEFKQAISLSVIIDRWKSFAQMDHLRLALPPKFRLPSTSKCAFHTFEEPADAVDWKDQPSIRSIAICVGSGGSLFKDLIFADKFKPDLLFTGEMGHTDARNFASYLNIPAIITEHTNCERGYLQSILLPKLKEFFTDNLDEYDIFVSNQDRDPIIII